MRIYFFILSSLILWGCRQNCRDQLLQFYKTRRSHFIQTKEAQGFSIEMAYFPPFFMAGKNNGEMLKLKDTLYYSFKVNIALHKANEQTSTANTGNLQYGLDSLFVAEKSGALPVMVEPIVKGSYKNIEYLVVFERSTFDSGMADIAIAFSDRVFSNTKLVFHFDKNKIDQLENLSCTSL